MVNETVPSNVLSKLDDVLTKEQVRQIVKQSLKDQNNWELLFAEIRPAADGMMGFLGDHLKLILHVTVNGTTEKIHLFIKRIPSDNKSKLEFIEDNGFFKREHLMFQLIDEMQSADDENPWCVKVLINTKSLFVMRDVSIQGYSTYPAIEYFDLPHTLVAVTSIARYHADLTNYQARRSKNENRRWTFFEQYSDFLDESNFKESPWLHCAIKLTSNLIKIFSKKYNNIPDLESKLAKIFTEGCNSIKEYNETLNVIIHKDLWANNIMFRYEKGVPCHALLVDFQCCRYVPPAFDLAVFLYYNTSRSFRKQHEKEIFQHYYRVFSERLEDHSKIELKRLGYDQEDFLKWYEKSRMFALVLANSLCPLTLMDPKTAQKIFNDPETYDEYFIQDRTKPVVAYCHENEMYKMRQLESCEEFVERYVLKQ
ncbi:uncharacterized protein ACR2FA_008211 [Aphomia sociella]